MCHDLDVLLDGLACPDPDVRDGWAYSELAAGIESGRFDGDRERIRAAALTHLAAEQVQARTFAPLILAWLVGAGDRDRDAFEAVARWYPAEADTRGYDERLGWLHAVAHGADYLGECARTRIATASQVLDVLAARLLGPGPAWHEQEYARVARAAVIALGGATEAESAGWLDPMNAALESFEQSSPSGRPPAWLHNAYTTCTTLYTALSEQPRDGDTGIRVDHADTARGALARPIARMTPWLLAPR